MRIITLLPIAALVVSAACAAPESTATDPRAVVAEMTESAWNRGEVETLSATMADTVIFHYSGEARVMAREELGAAVLRWREAFPDLEMAIEAMIQEGDLVAGRFTLTGTQEGPWLNAEPTGRAVSMPLMLFFRVEDGRVVELWEVDDQLGLRRQLGLLP